jgi:hypothetical protein
MRREDAKNNIRREAGRRARGYRVKYSTRLKKRSRETRGQG